MINLIRRFNASCNLLPAALLGLVARLGIGLVFWRSAQTKLAGAEWLGQRWQFWNLGDGTILLFSYEYKLPVLDPELAAWAATQGEFWLSLLLLIGLGTRAAALGLLSMTAVIQFLVLPEGWPTHLLWAGLLLYLLRHGAGALSIDAALAASYGNGRLPRR